ncbi:peptide ABC transporter permease [Bacillus sp. FJAT-27264]|uniref:ABC transporter permease n=1 Tax=Paenibacillus sp. (strain DSM 101736 / FJAT-27264) TaxID=1850362 RepID=UPI000807EABD|nr:ABC transporter permease [Bacillus sp. FJAT-27264]OBZ09734.1 peptide ABC transporter permease [Bacillus sp. FJAT-27264]
MEKIAATALVSQSSSEQERKSVGIIRLLTSNRLSMIGLLLIIVWIALALLAPLLSPYSPIEPDVANKLTPPSVSHWFGTDNFGRDIFTRIAYGAKYTIWSGVAAVAISFCVGTILGAIAGYYGGVLGSIIMRVMDMFLAFPALVLAMAIAASIGPGLTSAMIAVSVVGIPEYVRLMYGQTMLLREKEFVEAGRAIGLKNSVILFRHILPNALAPLIVRATLGIGFAILISSSLNFLGLGVKPPIAEWGAMIAEGRQYIVSGEWWIVSFPGLAIATSILGFNLIGDGLRDVLDPRLRSSSGNKKNN